MGDTVSVIFLSKSLLFFKKTIDVLQSFLQLPHTFILPFAFFFLLWRQCHYAKELLVNELSEPPFLNSFVYCCLCNRNPFSVPCNAGLINRSILPLHITCKWQGGHWWCEKHAHPNSISLIGETLGCIDCTLHIFTYTHTHPLLYVGC